MNAFDALFNKCAACGRNGAKVIDHNGKMFCVDCARLFGTCAMCTHSRTCNFETDPTSDPQFIVRTIRQEVPGGFWKQFYSRHGRCFNSKKIFVPCANDL